MNFEALITAEQPGLTRRLARSLGGDVSAAEDLCQEVLVRAWRKLPRDAEPAAQRAWLRRTATNVMIDELRRRGRGATVALESAGEVAAQDTSEPDAARAALAELSPHDRLLILLRFDAGLQHGEIAQLLAISEEAARKRVTRARKVFVRAYRRVRSDGPPLVLLGSHDRDKEPYVRWLERAGATVRHVTEQPSERELALADGLVFAGAYDDIHSGRTAKLRAAFVARSTSAAIARTWQWSRRCWRSTSPTSASAAAHQLLNIACGGSLYQDVVLDGAAAGSHDTGRHVVETLPDSSSRSLYGRDVDVMSEHHQAVREVGRNLRVAAISRDGVIESIEHRRGRFALGVQWHPEAAVGGEGARLADAFVQAADGEAA